MARRGSRVSLAEKLEISEKTLAGKSDPEIAKELER
jgi:acetylglutamate kinase